MKRSASLALHRMHKLLVDDVLVHSILSDISLHVSVAAVAQRPYMIIVLLDLLLYLLLLDHLLLLSRGSILVRWGGLLDPIGRGIHLELLLVFLLVLSLLLLAAEWIVRPWLVASTLISRVVKLSILVLHLHLHHLLLLLVQNLLDFISILHCGAHINTTGVLFHDSTAATSIMICRWTLGVPSLTFSGTAVSCPSFLTQLSEVSLVLRGIQIHHLHIWSHRVVLLMHLYLVDALEPLDRIITSLEVSADRSIDLLLVLGLLRFWAIWPSLRNVLLVSLRLLLDHRRVVHLRNHSASS